MSAFPVLEFGAVINTPTAQQNVVVTLSHAPDRLRTFDISIRFSADKIAMGTMRVNMLRAAFANPGQLVDVGRVSVMADASHNIVTIYLPAWDGDYALLWLDAQAVQSFVDNVAATVVSKWPLVQAVNGVMEQAIGEVASEGFAELCKWLARQ